MRYVKGKGYIIAEDLDGIGYVISCDVPEYLLKELYFEGYIFVNHFSDDKFYLSKDDGSLIYNFHSLVLFLKRLQFAHDCKCEKMAKK